MYTKASHARQARPRSIRSTLIGLMVAVLLPALARSVPALAGALLLVGASNSMLDLSMNIPQREIRDIKIFAEENQNILFLEITKR